MAENFADLDVLIIGGGPGGLAAALWCADLGLKAVLFEKEPELGGQLLWTFGAIKNYLGIEATSGKELRDRFLQSIENTNVMHVVEAPVVRANLTKRRIILADEKQYAASAIIIATGVRRRKLGVPGEDEFWARGILDSGVRSKDEVAGKTVLIVGGGDAALENALILSDTAAKVTVVHRRGEFTARKDFVQQAKETANIEFLTNTCVTAIIGNTAVEAVELQKAVAGKRSTIGVDAVLIRIGVIPNTELFCGQIDLDAAGYITVNSKCETNFEGVYAVGDVANPVSPTISSAVGNGVVATKLAARRINAGILDD